MHYKRIQKDTPEAFKKLKKWINAETKGILQFELMMILKNERDLYDFFDDHNLQIMISPQHWRDGISWNYSITSYDKLDFCMVECAENLCSKTRKEAEKVAYKKAFNLLEKQ